MDNATAEHTAERFGQVLNRFDAAMRLSMTYDNGREIPSSTLPPHFHPISPTIVAPKFQTVI